MELQLEFIELKLKVPWKLSRNTSLSKTNGILTLKCEEGIFYSEIAPNVRYHESIERLEKEISIFKELLQTTDFLTALDSYHFANSTRFALEALWIQKESKKNNQSIHQYLGIAQPRSMPTSFSLPIMDISEIQKYLEDIKRFEYLKVKINQEFAWDLVNEVSRFSSAKLRIDGNEAFSDFDSYIQDQ